jgi:hypothetical protein
LEIALVGVLVLVLDNKEPFEYDDENKSDLPDLISIIENTRLKVIAALRRGDSLRLGLSGRGPGSQPHPTMNKPHFHP